MNLSIITTSLNSSKTLEDTIKSVLSQSYSDIEYIVIDGGSTDGTLDIIDKYKDRIQHVISEPDKGIYDAINKGIELATGDIIGILNSDDFYIDNNVIETVVNEFQKRDINCLWGDMLVVDREDGNKIIRNWKSSEYKEGKFQKGWHPPHPTFFVKRDIYEKYGNFRTDLSTASDYELMLRFLEKHKISFSYIPKVLVKMRAGGESNKNYFRWIRANWYSYKAFKKNGLKASPFFVLRKPLSKIKQFNKS